MSYDRKFKLDMSYIKLIYEHFLYNFYYDNLHRFTSSSKCLEFLEKIMNDINIKLTHKLNKYDLFKEDISDSEKENLHMYLLNIVHKNILKSSIKFLETKNEMFYTFINKKINQLYNKINTLKNKTIDIDLTKYSDIYFLHMSKLLKSYKDDNKEDGGNDYDEDGCEDYDDENYEDYDDEDYDDYDDDEGDDDEGDEDYEGEGDDDDEEDGSSEYEEDEDGNKRNERNTNNNLDKVFSNLIKNRTKNPPTILNEFKTLSQGDKKCIVDELNIINKDVLNNNISMKILKSDMSLNEKKELLYKVETSQENKKGKFAEYIETILRFPYKKYIKTSIEDLKTPDDIKNFLDNANNILNSVVYGHDEAKHMIKCHLAQMITNPKSTGKIIGIQGPMGNGKTTLIEHGLSKILDLPFILIPLAGLSDVSFLIGHNYTYEGSRPGKIAVELIDKGVLNPVIFCDELDKVSSSVKGREIINKLIQLIDPVQNNHYQDAYFGNINIDLSRAHFIFSWNDSSKIDPILLDRITIIKTKGFNVKQKIIIAKNYIIPKLIEEIGIKHKVIIENEVIEYIINKLTYEGGVRKMKELLFQILSEFNLQNIIKHVKNKNKFVINIKNINDYLKDKIPHNELIIKDTNTIGNVVGLYATINDVGGIIPIETRWCPSESMLSLNLTGNLGKIMKESANVAKTIAWERTDEVIKKDILDTKGGTSKHGIHIHCYEASIEKEGPSAGTALAVCLYSMFNKIPIKRDVGITGELNLSGDVMKIGGLEEKFYGAKLAGCKIVLFPLANVPDYNKIIHKNHDLFNDNFKAIPISTFDDALIYSLQRDIEDTNILQDSSNKRKR
jgi:ATP-dependent Lon protease